MIYLRIPLYYCILILITIGCTQKNDGLNLIKQNAQNSIYCTVATKSEDFTTNCFFPKSPEFPDGNSALYKFLDDNLTYPKPDSSVKLPGRVFVSFTVNVDGSLSDIKVLKGLSPQHDMEVIRIMKLMPKWKPGGRSENELSPIKYNLPIRFN